MAWSEIPDADVDVGSVLDEDLFVRIRDNLVALRAFLFSFLFAEQTTSSGTFVDLASAQVFVPDLTDDPDVTRAATVIVEGKQASGAGELRLKDSASGNTGSAVAVSSSSYSDKTLTLALDNAWAGTIRTLVVQGRITSGATLAAQSVNRVAGTLVY